jgi:hypothetical protein
LVDNNKHHFILFFHKEDKYFPPTYIEKSQKVIKSKL